MKAVIWTDVFQSFVMIGGMLIIVFAVSGIIIYVLQFNECAIPPNVDF